MQCAQCGKELKDGEVCTCQAQQPVYQPPAPLPVKKSRKKILIAIVIVAIVLVAVLVAAVVLMNSGNTNKSASEIMLTTSDLGAGWTSTQMSSTTSSYSLSATGTTDVATAAFIDGSYNTVGVSVMKFQNTANAKNVMGQAKDQASIFSSNSAGIGDDSILYSTGTLVMIYFQKDNVVVSFVSIGPSLSEAKAYAQIIADRI